MRVLQCSPRSARTVRPKYAALSCERPDPARGTVDIFTDATTTKCAEIAADPRVALTLWREDMLLQIRMRGTMAIIEGDTARAAWNDLPEAPCPTMA